MQFHTNISYEEHDAFIRTHPLCNLLQSSSWANIKCGWEHCIAGVSRSGQLVASALILIKPLPIGFTMFYIPRGPILDYDDEKLLHFYFQELTHFARKRHCLFIKFDPAIHLRDFTWHQKDPSYNLLAQQMMKNIQGIAAVHKGYTTSFKETIQPRFCMGINCCDELMHQFPPATIRSIHVAMRKHVVVRQAGIEELDAFENIIHMCEKRKSIQLRDKAYFQRLMETYGDHAYLFFACVDPHQRFQELQQDICTHKQTLKTTIGKKQCKKIKQEIEQMQQELCSLQNVVKIYQGEQIIAGGLMVGFHDTVEMLYAGMNEDFTSFRPQYLLYMEQFQYAHRMGYRYVNMGGVEGTLEDGLAKFKANFNPVIHEYVGEFDLPIHPFLYHISNWFYTQRRKHL